MMTFQPTDIGPDTIDGIDIAIVVKIIIPKTHRNILVFCITRCSREYMTSDCGMVISHQDRYINGIDALVFVMTWKSARIIASGCNRIPHEHNAQLQK